MLKKIHHFISCGLTIVRFYREWFFDANRYLSSAKVVTLGSKHAIHHLESDIIRRYHVIEKGLAMPDFRPCFGREMVIQLRDLLAKWEQNVSSGSGRRNNQIEAAYAVLRAYEDRHKAVGVDVSDILGDFKACHTEGGRGGVTTIRSVAEADAVIFRRVVESRVSVRSFRDGVAPRRETIERAVSLAIRSPSVCNRQTWRVHVYSGNRAQRLLALQNGNRGFGHTIPCVLVVTSDMRYFTGLIERYQAWIDGGMFSMTLLLALHAERLGAVALNWSVLNDRDRQLREIGVIPEHERIIMLIGCGHPREEALVAVSERRPLDDFVRWDEPS